MNYKHSATDALATFELEGNMLSALQGEELRSLIADYLAKGVKKFLFDMHAMKHANSIGIGIFVGLHKQVNEGGGQLVYCQLSDSLQNLLRLTKLNTYLDIADSRELGIEKLKGQA